MILSAVGCAVAAGVLVYTRKGDLGRSDAKKIQRICANVGLKVNEAGATRTMHLLTRRGGAGFTDYIYRIPLGLSFGDFEAKLDAIQDGLNNRTGRVEIRWNDVMKARTFRDLKRALTRRQARVNKTVDLSYDGTLKIRVYNDKLTEFYAYDDELLARCEGWSVPVGHTREETIFHDFERIPHMLIAGATDKGKSVYLKNVITTLLETQSDAVTFDLIDLKGGLSFARYRDCRQVTSLAKSPEEALAVLEAVQARLTAKMEWLLAKGYEDIKEAGDKRRHFIVIDEAAELSSSGEVDREQKRVKIRCEQIITDIARRGRAAGFRLLYATQYPTNETIRSQVRQNIGGRVCFMLETGAASRAVLDEEGAEKLPRIKGRAIYRTDRKVIVQAPYISNDYINDKIAKHKTKKEAAKLDEPRPTQTTARRSDTLNFEETELL